MPTFFMGVLYYRLSKLLVDANTQQSLVTGNLLEGSVWILLVLAFTFIVARVRTARFMLFFKDVEWAFSTPAKADRTFFSLAQYLTPIFYPPRAYHVFSDGIVVEGYLYAFAMPFSEIQTVERIHPRAHLTEGFFLACSRRKLIRLKYRSSHVSIYISPREPEVVIDYLKLRLVAHLPEITRALPILEEDFQYEESQ